MVCLNSQGNIFAVSNPGKGKVKAYRYYSGSWSQFGDDMLCENVSDGFGQSLSINSNGYRIAVGAKYSSSGGTTSGSIKVFEIIGNNWVQLGNTIIGLEYEKIGSSVSLNDEGNILAVGAMNNSTNDTLSGRVCVYKLNETSNLWGQHGNTVYGEYPEDYSGNCVSLN